MPVYYLSTFGCIPPAYAGFGLLQYEPTGFAASVVLSIIPFATLFLPLYFLPHNFEVNAINVPGWTVCSLLIMWFLFPWILMSAQDLTDHQLVRHYLA